MQRFLKSEKYLSMKKKYEKQYFKLFGKYASYNGDKITYRSKEETKEYFKNKSMTITYENDEGETVKKTKTFYDVWSTDEKMREYTDVVFDANVSKVTKEQFNLFQGFDHLEENKPEKTIKLDVIYEHMRSLVNYDEDAFNYLLNFLAHLVQKPWELPDVALIFISEEGVGKDIFGRFCSNSIGKRYSGITEKLELICGKFNSALGGKLFFIINETNPVESRERQENIKSIITAKDFFIEGKHKDPVPCKNYCRFIFFSNRLMAFPVDQGSRRPWIVQCSNKYTKEVIGAVENKKYFDKLVPMYESTDYQYAFLEMLKKRDISKWNPKNFEKSKLHQTLEDNSVSPIITYLAQIVKENIKKETYTASTTLALKQFTEMLKTQNAKFDYGQSKFNVELESILGVKKSKSSTMKFTIDIPILKELLETNYKYTFEEGEINEEDYNELPLEMQIKNVDNEIYALQQKLAQLKQKLKEEQEEKNKEKVAEEKEEKPKTATKEQKAQEALMKVNNTKETSKTTKTKTFDDYAEKPKKAVKKDPKEIELENPIFAGMKKVDKDLDYKSFDDLLGNN
jgi:hypothetical protein